MTTPLKLFLLLLLSTTFLNAQESKTLKELYKEGVTLHDKRDYKGAIKKYDEALSQDKFNAHLLYEKSLSYMAMGNYKAAIKFCKLNIKKNPESEILKYAYTCYGNSTDALKKPKQALQIYNEGLLKFPYSHQLHFNKGITLSGLNQYDNAQASFEQAIKIHPTHASSHNALGSILAYKKMKIPSLLAYCRFLIIEPQGKRAELNLNAIQKNLSTNVIKNSENNYTININTINTNKENNFSSIDMLLALSTASSIADKDKPISDFEFLKKQLEMLFGMLKNNAEQNSGFYWEYYAPYFSELHEKEFMEVFSRLIYASTNDKETINWLKENKNELKKFQKWSSNYSW